MLKIYCFGDSLTFGESDIEGGGWASRLQRKMMGQGSDKDYLDTLVYNLGIASETTDGLVRRFESEVSHRKYKDEKSVFIFQYGLNDLVVHKDKNLVPEKYFKKNLTQCIQTAREFSKDAEIILLGLTPVKADDKGVSNIQGKVRLASDIERYQSYMVELAELHSARLINAKSTIENAPDWQARDGLHWSASGHQLVSDVVFSLIV